MASALYVLLALGLGQAVSAQNTTCINPPVITQAPTTSYQSMGPGGATTTYTVVYSMPCSTGMAPVTYTVASQCAGTCTAPNPTGVPAGFTVTKTVCTACATPGTRHCHGAMLVDDRGPLPDLHQRPNRPDRGLLDLPRPAAPSYSWITRRARRTRRTRRTSCPHLRRRGIGQSCLSLGRLGGTGPGSVHRRRQPRCSRRGRCLPGSSHCLSKPRRCCFNRIVHQRCQRSGQRPGQCPGQCPGQRSRQRSGQRSRRHILFQTRSIHRLGSIDQGPGCGACLGSCFFRSLHVIGS